MFYIYIDFCCPLYKKGVLGVHDLHIFSDPVTDFWKCPKKGFKKYFFCIFFFTKEGGLIGSMKTQFKHLKFGMVVNWQNYFLVDTQNFF